MLCQIRYLWILKHEKSWHTGIYHHWIESSIRNKLFFSEEECIIKCWEQLAWQIVLVCPRLRLCWTLYMYWMCYVGQTWHFQYPFKGQNDRSLSVIFSTGNTVISAYVVFFNTTLYFKWYVRICFFRNPDSSPDFSISRL